MALVSLASVGGSQTVGSSLLTDWPRREAAVVLGREAAAVLRRETAAVLRRETAAVLRREAAAVLRRETAAVLRREAAAVPLSIAPSHRRIVTATSGISGDLQLPGGACFAALSTGVGRRGQSLLGSHRAGDTATRSAAGKNLLWRAALTRPGRRFKAASDVGHSAGTRRSPRRPLPAAAPPALLSHARTRASTAHRHARTHAVCGE